MPKRFEQWFESVLWNSRLMVLVGVVASCVMAFGAIIVASVDVVTLVGTVFTYLLDTVEDRGELRGKIITLIVKALDGYLIAAILLIVAFGLYELFISRLDAAQSSETAPRLLKIRNLDDLKDRLAKVILLVLAIEFFQRAASIDYQTSLDLLYLGAGMLLVGATIALSSLKPSTKAITPKPEADPPQ